MKNFTKYFWVILLILGVATASAYWAGIVMVLEFLLIAVLIGGIFYYLYKIPAIKTALKKFWQALNNQPVICIAILTALLVIVLLFIFVPRATTL